MNEIRLINVMEVYDDWIKLVKECEKPNNILIEVQASVDNPR